MLHPFSQAIGMPLKKLISFLVVGGLAAGAYALACTILVQWFPAHKAEISIGVYAGLIPFAFFGQRHFTFRSSGHGLSKFLKYACLQIASISLSTLLLGQLVTGRPLYDVAAFLLIGGLASIVSFAVCNTVIFRAASRQLL